MNERMNERMNKCINGLMTLIKELITYNADPAMKELKYLQGS